MPFEIRHEIVLDNVTLAETEVNSDFTVTRTVTMTEDMVLAADVTIYADRAPFPLADGATVRGTLVGEGNVNIDGDGYDLTLEDKLKLKNLTLKDEGSEWIKIALGATVAFEDVTYNPDDLNDDDGTLVIDP